MKNSNQSAPLYKPPSASDFQRVLRLWKKHSPESKRTLEGSEAQKLSLFFNTSIFHTLLRLDALAIPHQGAPQRQMRQFKAEKNKLRRDIKLCSEIGRYLVRCKLATDHR